MLKSHEKFFTENGKHLILVASDNPQERAFFEKILREEYIVMLATSEPEAEALIRESGDVLSLR